MPRGKLTEARTVASFASFFVFNYVFTFAPLCIISVYGHKPFRPFRRKKRGRRGYPGGPVLFTTTAQDPSRSPKKPSHPDCSPRFRHRPFLRRRPANRTPCPDHQRRQMGDRRRAPDRTGRVSRARHAPWPGLFHFAVLPRPDAERPGDPFLHERILPPLRAKPGRPLQPRDPRPPVRPS